MIWSCTLVVDGVRFTANRPTVDWDRSTAILSRSPSRQTCQVEADFTADLRALASRGHDLSRGRLSVYADGVLVAQGRPQSVTMGAGRGSARMTITEDVRDDRGVFPGNSEVGRRVGDDEDEPEAHDDVDLVSPTIDRGVFPAKPGTWPDADLSAEGKAYPVIIGRPTGDAVWPLEGYDVRATGSRPLLLLAGHRLRGIGDAAPEVRVRGSHLDRDDYVTYAVSHLVDSAGRTIAAVDMATTPTSGTSYGRDVSDPHYYVSYTAAQGYGPGAGTLISLLLEHSTLRIDRAAWAAVRDELDGFVLAGAVTETVRPVQFIEQVVLPLLPLSLDVGPRGLRPALWRLDARAADATHHLQLGADLAWESGPDPVPPTANDLTLRYAHDVERDRFTGTALANERTHAHLAVSTGAGRRRAEPIETRLVYDAAVAERMLGWRSLAFGVTRRRVTYQMPLRRFGVGAARELRPGDIVTVTDAARGLSRLPAIVERLRQRSDRLTATFLLLDPGTVARWGG